MWRETDCQDYTLLSIRHFSHSKANSETPPTKLCTVGVCLQVHLQSGFTDLSSDKSLKTGLEVVYATVVEFGHLLEQLLVLSLKVFLDWSKLFPGLRCEEEREKCSVTLASSICNFMQNFSFALVLMFQYKHIHPQKMSEKIVETIFCVFSYW